MADLTFTAGERATLDLRESAGDVALRDHQESAIRIATTAQRSPFVLREQDTFRIRLDEGGAITVPASLPVEVVVPPAVHLRLLRSGGETVVRPLDPTPAGAAAGTGGGATSEAGASFGEAPDLTAFARIVSEQGRRLLSEMTRTARGGDGAPEEVARWMNEAAGRIDQQAARAAERVQKEAERVRREVERAFHVAERAQEHSRRAAERAQERAGRAGERAERAGRRAGRGRWWFTEKLDEWSAGMGAGAGAGAGTGAGTGAGPGTGRAASASRATQEERRVILDMLAQGKISAEQASKLLDALGG